MSFMLALPKISLHGAGAIGDMVTLVATRQWGKALIVTDGQLVKLGLLDKRLGLVGEELERIQAQVQRLETRREDQSREIDALKTDEQIEFVGPAKTGHYAPANS